MAQPRFVAALLGTALIVATVVFAPGAAADAKVVERCHIADGRLPEISGMATSVRHPGIVWVHNDSGSKPRVFALDTTTCQVRATISLVGVAWVDTEAIAVGRNAAGQPVIWVADTGDNRRERTVIQLYRFNEPDLTDRTIEPDVFSIRYPDGVHDTEGLLVDPVPAGQIWLTTKEATGAALYSLPRPLPSGVVSTAARSTPIQPLVTDAAIAPDRSGTVLLAKHDRGTFYRGLPPGTAPTPTTFPVQVKGEAVTYSADAQSVFLTTEGSGALLQVPLEHFRLAPKPGADPAPRPDPAVTPPERPGTPAGEVSTPPRLTAAVRGTVARRLPTGKRTQLPRRTTTGQVIRWRSLRPAICRVHGHRIRGLRPGTCRVKATAAPTPAAPRLQLKVKIQIR